MKLFTNQYSLHNLVNISIASSDAKPAGYIHGKYNHFSVDKIDKADIEVTVRPFEFPKEDGASKRGIYYVGKDYIFWGGKRRFAKWKVCISGLEDDMLRISFWGNHISFKYLCIYILEPLINIKMATKGFALLHASAVEIAGKTYIFCSLPGCGKTSLTLSLLETAKGSFLSDEFVILSGNAEVFSFIMPIAICDYNIARIPNLRFRISSKESVSLGIKKLIRILTSNRVNIPTQINFNRLYPNSELVTKGELKKLYVLDKITNEKASIEQISIDKIVDEIMKINYHQFRFFYEAFDTYLSERPQSNLKTIYATQKEILLNALRGKEFSKILVADVLDLDKKTMADILA